MAQVTADRRDIDFVLYEQFDTEAILKNERYKGFNRKMFDLILKEARNFAAKEILPTYAEGDRNGARFENGKVTVPECYRRPFELFREGEWSSLSEDPEFGGQGLPTMPPVHSLSPYPSTRGVPTSASHFLCISPGTGAPPERTRRRELKS